MLVTITRETGSSRWQRHHLGAPTDCSDGSADCAAVSALDVPVAESVPSRCRACS